MRIVTQNDLVYELQAGLKNPDRIALVDYTENQVNYGFDAKPNFEYCNAHNIKCVDIGRRGGAFVINKGDWGIGYVGKGLDNSLGEKVYKSFEKYLQTRGFNAIAVGNDILIDGYKVFGWSSHYYKDYDAIFITMHFTMSVDIDLIKSVCTKPMNKTPKGLKDYGISRNEIKDFILSTMEDLL
jgi:hypothetical protein